MKKKRRYKKIVIDGGPCSGKTTGMAYLYEKLEDSGVSVIVCPEVATAIITSGLKPGEINKKNFLRFQDLILKTQINFEDNIFGPSLEIKGGRRQVMLCDRGCMTNMAYTGERAFMAMLKRLGLNLVDVCEGRYDSVIHLVTAAIGKPKFYNLNNPARTETRKQARDLDLLTRHAWIGHPHPGIIDNSTNFKRKLKRLLNMVRKDLGIPVSLEIERRFLVKDGLEALSRIPKPYRVVDIEQYYITDENGVNARVRKRSRANGSVYYKTIKINTKDNSERVEIENFISELEFNESLAMRRKNYEKIFKHRVCFLHKNQYFELDIYKEPQRHKGLVRLEIELTEKNDKIIIPKFLGRVKEVTDDDQYKDANLARIDT